MQSIGHDNRTEKLTYNRAIRSLKVDASGPPMSPGRRTVNVSCLREATRRLTEHPTQSHSETMSKRLVGDTVGLTVVVVVQYGGRAGHRRGATQASLPAHGQPLTRLGL